MRFDIYLLYAYNPETGEDFVVLSDAELDEEQSIALSNLETLMDARRDIGEPSELIEKYQRGQSAMIRAEIDRQRKDRDAAMARGVFQTLQFHCLKPTYREHLEAVNLAKNMDDEGEQHWSEEDYTQELLRDHVTGYHVVLSRENPRKKGEEIAFDSLEDILDQSVVVVQTLGRRIRRAAVADQARLPFIASPSGSTTKANSTITPR